MRLIKLAAIIALLPLGACQTLGLSSSDDSAPPEPAAGPAPTLVAQPCPYTAVLSEASKVTILNGSGQTSRDVAMTAEMSPPRVECEYDPITRVDTIDLNFPLLITKGPAARSDESQITYFVALLNLAGEVIAKKVYQRRVAFEGKQSFIATESVGNLVLTLGPGTKPTDHRLLIGFQLTPAQLAYNRMKATTPPPPPPAPVITSPAAPGPTTGAATPPAGTPTAAPIAAQESSPTSVAVQVPPGSEESDETPSEPAPPPGTRATTMSAPAGESTTGPATTPAVPAAAESTPPAPTETVSTPPEPTQTAATPPAPTETAAPPPEATATTTPPPDEAPQTQDAQPPAQAASTAPAAASPPSPPAPPAHQPVVTSPQTAIPASEAEPIPPAPPPGQ